LSDCVKFVFSREFPLPTHFTGYIPKFQSFGALCCNPYVKPFYFFSDFYANFVVMIVVVVVASIIVVAFVVLMFRTRQRST